MKRKSAPIAPISLLIALLLALAIGPVLLQAQAPASADLNAVWQRVQAAGAYHFRSDVVQTSAPQASVINAGRGNKTSKMHMEGATDLANETMNLTLWTNGGSVLDPASGVEIRVDGDHAVGRQGAGPWQEIEGFTGLFAPGGDLMAYAKAAENVVNHGAEIRTTPLGNVTITRYTFAVNGRRFAAQMRTRLQEQALADGLPASVHTDLPRAYAEMTGTGELWVDANGLPLRQIFQIAFPPDNHDYATTANITVDFSGFTPAPSATRLYRVSRSISAGWSALTTTQSLTASVALGLSLLLAAVIILRRRARTVYGAVAFSVIFSMLAVPLLTNQRVAAYSAQQAAKQEQHDQQRAEADAQTDLQTAAQAAQVDPHRAPLAMAQQQVAAATGGSRYYDDRCASDPNSDLDGDGLTNLEECLLGTLIDAADSDQDGASDYLEVTGFTYNNTTWYTDPLNQDSNNDGIGDGKEWHLDADNNQIPDDTDGDGTPDLWDDDNDDDGVRDSLDLSPYVTTKDQAAFSDAQPFGLKIDDLTANEVVRVEFQLRPTNDAHLWYSQSVLDWPQGDQQAQVQDVDGQTFYDLDPTLSPAPNANGDVRMVPMLEIAMAKATANLPAETCTNSDGSTYTCYPLLEQFGISVQQTDADTLTAYVPVQVVSDDTGNANVAFYARMFYQATANWGAAHQVRLVWLVQALNDLCSAYENGFCSAYSQLNQTQVIHAYDDDWYMTGLHVMEEHSADVDVIYEDPKETPKIQPGADDSPLYVDTLYGLLYGLDYSFLAGRDCDSTDTSGSCVGNGQLDVTVDTIGDRFNHATNNYNVNDAAYWGLPNVLTVVKNGVARTPGDGYGSYAAIPTYDSIDLAMLDTTVTQTVKVLDNVFTGVWSANKPITPTIMVAYQQTYRDFNLDQGVNQDQNLSWSGNNLTLSLPQSGANAVAVSTMTAVKWTPYAYDPATGWAPADTQAFWETMNQQLASSFSDISDPDEAQTDQTMAQATYLSAYSGLSGVVQTGDVITSPAYQKPDAPFFLTASGYAGKTVKYTVQYYYTYSPTLERMAYRIQRMADRADLTFSEATSSYFRQQVLDWWNTPTELTDTAFGVFVLVAGAAAVFGLVVNYAFPNASSGVTTAGRIAASVGVGLLMGYFTVLKSVLKVYRLAAAAVEEGATWASAIGSTLTASSTVLGAVKAANVIGLILSIGLAIGMFIYVWASGAASPGTVAFNGAIAQMIAAIVVAVVFFVLALSVIGVILLSILALVDTILGLAGVKWTFTGKITSAIASVIYQYNVYTKQDQQTGDLANTLLNPEAGLAAGNQFSFTLPITTTLTQADALWNTPSIRKNSLVYELSPVQRSLATTRDERYNDWVTPNDDTARVTDYPSAPIDLTSGVNRQLPLNLNSAWALGAQSCWVGFCSDKTLTGNASTAMNDGLLFDIFPQTIDEFVDTSGSGWSLGRLRTVDADGDGLLAQSAGGLDPDDAKWDSDGDGLADAYELALRSLSGDQGGADLDPLLADTDNDGVPDGVEVRWGTDPGNQDSDDDGIPDVAELPYVRNSKGELNVGGWALPYAPTKSTRVWSDPLQADGDSDGLSDLFERTQVTCPTCTPWTDPSNPAVFNPNVWNVSPVALFVTDNSTDGYVKPGATVVYTSTTVNNLSGGQLLAGKLNVVAPTGFSAANTEASVTVNSGFTESLVSILTVNANTSLTGSVASTMQLTDFASTVWSWDAPLTASSSGGDKLAEVDALAVTGWNEPILMATHNVAADGSQRVVASVANVAGEVRQSLALIETGATVGLTRPAIACTDDGDCLVVWGQNDADQTGSLWISLLSSRLPAAAATRQMWSVASTMILAPTVATSNGDYMLTWATEAGGTATLWSLPLDSTGGFKYTYPANQPPVLVEPTAFHTAASAAVSSPQSNWMGSNYGAVWAENGSILRAAINASTGAAGAPATVAAGQGWSQSAGLSRPPAAVLDPISLQALLIYRGADNHLYGGRLNAAGAFAPLALDTGNNFNVAGVQTTLCADPINGGWVAAWARPGANIINYQAIGPDGALRGSRQAIGQSAATGLALACSAARPVIDLEFEEAAGATTFADSSGFGNSASCTTGACPLAGVQGRFGRAVHFNGTNEYLSIPNNADFNFAADEDFTVSFWVNAEATQLDTAAPDNSIVAKWSNAGGGYPFVVRYLHQTGQVYGARYDGAHSSKVTSVQAINDGQFHHVAFVKNGAYLSLYIDGVQSGASVPDTTTGTTTNAYPIYLGMRGGNGGSNHFAGTLDRLQIYPRALLLQEIGGIFDAASAIYDLDEVAGSQTFVDGSGNELTATCQGATCPVMGAAGVADTAATFDGVNDMITVAPVKRVVTSYRYDFEADVGTEWSTSYLSAVLALKLDEANGATTFADSSGSGANATCVAGTCPVAGVTGQIDRAVQFNGSSEYLTVPNNGAFNFTANQNFTVAFWVKAAATQQDTSRTDNSIVEKWSNDGGGYPFVVRYLPATGQVYGSRYDGTHNPSVTSVQSINDGQFHHVAFVKNGATLTLYIDGAQSGASVTDTTTGNTTNAYLLYLGMRGGGGGTNHFTGTLDEVRIFGAALDKSQINQVAFGPPRCCGADVFGGSDYWPGGGVYWLGGFGNERSGLTLNNLPLHDTVKVRFNLLIENGSNGWEGNMTAQGRGPDRWEWGYDSTPVLNTSFASCPDKTNQACWGFAQAYPGAYVATVPSGLEINGRNGALETYYKDTPDLANTAVGDNPTFGWTAALYGSAVAVYENANYGGTSMVFDFLAGPTSLKQTWPNWVSSFRIWPAQHQPQAGYTASYFTGEENLDGQAYTLEGAISGHTADSIALYFEGQTATTDPGGVELWALDNVQVTLERDETSIPLDNHSFTLAAWAKKTTPSQPGILISQGTRATDQGLHFGFRDTPVFTCAFYGDDLNTSDAALIDAEWHHWACTYDAVSKTRTIYRDGIRVAQDKASADYGGLGQTYIGSAFGENWFFNGQLDEVATWRGALTAGDIHDLYNKVKVQDQSVMAGTIFSTVGSASSNHNEVTLRETATNVGSIAQTTNRTLTVDADNPTICAGAGACPLAGQYVGNTGTLVVAGTAADPTSAISKVEANAGGWQLANGAGGWSYAWDISSLGDGEQTLPLRATDVVGHVSPVYNLNVIVDSTPPQVTLAAADGGEHHPTRDEQGRWQVALSGTVADPAAGSKAGSGVAEVAVLLTGAGALAGQGWQAAAVTGSNWNVDYLLPAFDAYGGSLEDPSGVYTVSVRAADALGNMTAAAAYPTAQLRLDANGPAITLAEPVSSTETISNAVTLSGQVSDDSAVSAVEVNFTPSEQLGALDGSLLRLPMDENQASEYFDDQSGANHNVTCSGSACPTVGQAGQRDGAFRFDGSNDSLRTPTILDPAATPFTAALWFNATTVNNSHALIQQTDGTGLGRAWLDVVNGHVRSNLATVELAGATAVTANTWHHAAVTFDGTTLTLYVDGHVDAQTTIVAEASDGGLLIGVFKDGSGSYSGLMDELVVYNRTLADYEVANLFAYGQGAWEPATVNNGAWRYTIPDGENGIEGFYQINVRGTDALGNVTPLGGQRVWRGEIDTKPPALSLTSITDESGAMPSVKYTCQASDFNLIESQTCQLVAPATVPVYRLSDLTTTTYDEVDKWYAATITDTSRLYQIKGMRIYSGTLDASATVQSCDLYNHCATAVVQPLTGAPFAPVGGEVLDPGVNTVLTSTEPVTVTGDAYAETGLKTLTILVNGAIVHSEHWQTADVLSTNWSFMWTPPGEGVYHFTPSIDHWAGDRPAVAASPAPTAPEQTPIEAAAVDHPGLPLHFYLPLVGNDATAGVAASANRAATLLHLPLVQSFVDVRGLYTGTVATIYVDLTPPTVSLAKRAWGRDDALGERIIELTGAASDTLGLDRVEVRIGDGPWDRAGLDEDGNWRWPWRFATPPAGESFQVTVRATDLAGRTAQVIEQVTVKLVAP